MRICDLLSEEVVLTNLEATGKQDLIEKIIDTLSAKVDTATLDAIKKAVIERESIMSTGVGKGLAIPHGKVPGLQQNFAVFTLLKKPIEFDSIDGLPVKIVFLLVGPEANNSAHIKMLSRISRLMNNAEFRDKLTSCQLPPEVLNAFKEEEAIHFGG